VASRAARSSDTRVIPPEGPVRLAFAEHWGRELMGLIAARSYSSAGVDHGSFLAFAMRVSDELGWRLAPDFLTYVSLPLGR